MNLIFIHGWSVTHTDTYGDLPQVLTAGAPDHGLNLRFIDLHLGRYISFHNEVRMDDVVRALDQALRDTLPDAAGGIAPFSCITHSTGGPVVRCWVERYYGAGELAECPLRHLVMLAPANHGSALAALGSARVGRLKSWIGGVEPGTGILRWLELGSSESRRLNHAWLHYKVLTPGSKFRPFVLTGETIDKKLYDHVNRYTGEVGSDGVVRVAAANLHHRWLPVKESARTVTMHEVFDEDGKPREAQLLVTDGPLETAEKCPFYIVPGASHSGDKIGIMRSPTLKNATKKPVVGAILDALSVTTKAAYEELQDKWDAANAATPGQPTRGKRFFQLVVSVMDDEGFPVTDYDFILLAGEQYDPDKLPKGFCIDKQANQHARHTITFYLDFDRMMAVRDGKFGFRLLGRPQNGFGHYRPAEFRSDATTIDAFVDPHTTLYLDITLKRHVDRETTRLDPATDGPRDFKKVRPSGLDVP